MSDEEIHIDIAELSDREQQLHHADVEAQADEASVEADPSQEPQKSTEDGLVLQDEYLDSERRLLSMVSPGSQQADFFKKLDSHGKRYHTWYMKFYRNVICKILPSVSWVVSYPKSIKQQLLGDLLAGATNAVLIIPQAMAYAVIAGLPPIYGLYSAFVPVLVYALLGTSRQLSVGPVAIVSLLTAEAIHGLNPKNASDYVTYAHVLAIMSGLIQFVLGFFHLGFLIDFLSHPVVAGFTSGAAIIIGGSQLKYVIGVSMPDTKEIYMLIYNLASLLPKTHWPTLVMSICLFLVLGFFRWMPPVPLFKRKGKWFRVNLQRLQPIVQLFLLSIAILIMYLLVRGADYSPSVLDEKKKTIHGIRIVGYVPPGLSPPVAPFTLTAEGETIWSLEKLQSIFLSSLSIAFVGVLESLSVSRFFANKNAYSLDASQELIALGASSISSGFFSGYPVTGGFSRTAVNASAGAKTPFAQLLSALLVMVALLALTPVLFYLPYPVLAAIIIMAVIKLISFEELWKSLRARSRDSLPFLVAFIGTTFVGVEEGIIIAAAISLALVLYRASRPSMEHLGRIKGSPGVYRAVSNFPDAVQIPGVLVLRFDADIFFASAQFFVDSVLRAVEESTTKIFVVVLNCEALNNADSSVPHAIEELAHALHKKHHGCRLYLARLKVKVRRILERTNIVATVYGPKKIRKDFKIPVIDVTVPKKIVMVLRQEPFYTWQAIYKSLRTSSRLGPIINRLAKSKKEPVILVPENHIFFDVRSAVNAAAEYILHEADEQQRRAVEAARQQEQAAQQQQPQELVVVQQPPAVTSSLEIEESHV